MLRPLRGYLVVVLGLIALAPALAAATTWLFKVMIDTVVVPGDLGAFPRLAVLFAILALAQGTVSFVDYYLTIWTGERFVLTLRDHLFTHLHRLTPDFLERRALGDVLTRLTTDVEVIEQLLLAQVSQALSYVFEVVFFTAALFLLDWRLAIAALLAAPGVLLLAQVFSRRIQTASREKSRRTGGISSVAEESLGNAALVRAYDRADAERSKFGVQNKASFVAQMTGTRYQALFGPLTNIIQLCGTLLVFGLAVWEVSQNHITIGGLLAFVAYLGQLFRPIQSIGQLINSMFSASASGERIIELLDQEPSVTESATPCRMPLSPGTVRFDKVSFRYPSAKNPTLSGVDLTVEPGQKIAVVGASGAGKSTIAKLLLRFYDPDEGRITLNGVDLRDLSFADLYSNISTVLQETLVFDGTIAENIGWGKTGATEEDIIRAATAADAHEFIVGLTDGYQTRVGQRARLLSGGQRQRIAIARALIRDAPILVLDEPTTGLDAESSERVLAPLRRLMAGRTTIIISHNLLTVTDADHILLLSQGHVTGSGNHDQLMATNPQYAQLYHLNCLSTPSVRPDPDPESLALAGAGRIDSASACIDSAG